MGALREGAEPLSSMDGGAALCVTGAPFGGTSTVARTLELLGVRFVPPGVEPPEVCDDPSAPGPAGVDARLLLALGVRWSSPTFDLPHDDDPRLVEGRERADEAIEAGRSEAGTWGWADPGTALLLPFWRRLVPAARTVVAVRDPRSVAQDLVSARDLHPEEAAGVWLRYTASAWREGVDPVFVIVERLARDPGQEAKALAFHMGLEEPDDEVLSEIRSVVRDEGAPLPGSSREDGLLRMAEAVYDGLTDGSSRSRRPSWESLLVAGADHADARSRERVLERRVEEQTELYESAVRDARRYLQRTRLAEERAAEVGREHEHFAGRRSVRAALKVAGVVRPTLDAVRRAVSTLRRARTGTAQRLPSSGTPREGGGATLEEQQILTARLREGLQTSRTSGPSVSIVIPNRDGEGHLRRCLPALAATAYEPFEVVVVDNASTDGSLDYLASMEEELALRVVRNAVNRTFAEAINQGVDAGSGELVLLLNNDTEPVFSGWLGRMVDTLLERGAAVVGGRLIYPARPGGVALAWPDLSIQHAGLGFSGTPVPRFRALGKGRDPLEPWAAGVREVPAVTGACLLVRRVEYEAVGGLSEEYVFGTEDIDLCLRIAAEGGVVLYDGGTVLYHYEFGTRDTEGRDRLRHRHQNRKAFVDNWGPALSRQVLEDRIRGDRHWSPDPLRVGVVFRRGSGRRSFARALVRELGSHGWRVDLRAWRPKVAIPTGDLDVLVSLADGFPLPPSPGQPVAVAAVLDRPEGWTSQPWLDHYDLVLAGGERMAEAIGRGGPLRTVAVETGGDGGDENQSPRTWANGIQRAVEGWGGATRVALCVDASAVVGSSAHPDVRLGRAMRGHLEERGMPCRLYPRTSWDLEERARADVLVHLFAGTDLTPRPSQVNVLWVVGSPNLVSPTMCERYDIVLTASPCLARRLRGRVDVPVVLLRRGADPSGAEPDEALRSDVLIVDDSEGGGGSALVDVVPGRCRVLRLEDLAYGRAELGTEGTSDPDGSGCDVDELYASAGIVLHAHAPEDRRDQLLSARLYEALAAGAFVVSDAVPGMEEEFNGAVSTYGRRDEVPDVVSHYLAHPQEREVRASHGRRVVDERHTVAQRVDVLLECLEPLLRSHRRRITSASPTRR